MSPPRRARTATAALGAGLLAAVVAALLFQRRPYSDGPWLVDVLRLGGQVPAYPLYMPAAKGLRALVGLFGFELGPERTLQALNLVGAFLLGSGMHLAARGAGEREGASAAVAALALFTPSVLFFSTVIEPHGVHAGAVALAYALAEGMGAGSLLLRVVGLSVALLAVAGTHATGPLLAPGLLAWGAARARERGARLRLRHGVLFVLPWLLVALAGLAAWTEGFSRAPSLQGAMGPHGPWFLRRLEHWGGLSKVPAYLEAEFVLPSALAFAGGLAGLGRLVVLAPRYAVASALLVLPYAIVLSIWGYTPEEGSHFIPLAPWLALAAAGFLRSACRRPVGAASIVAALAPFAFAAAWRGGAGAWAAAATVVSAPLAGAWAGLRERRERDAPSANPGLALVCLALVAAGQAAFSVGALHERNRVDFEGEWAAGAAAALPPGAFVFTVGYQEPYLLRQKAGLEGLDLGIVADSDPVEGVRRLERDIRSGQVIAIEDRAVEAYTEDPRVAAVVRALRETFEWRPVAHGRFRAHRLFVRGEGEPPR